MIEQARYCGICMKLRPVALMVREVMLYSGKVEAVRGAWWRGAHCSVGDCKLDEIPGPLSVREAMVHPFQGVDDIG